MDQREENSAAGNTLTELAADRSTKMLLHRSKQPHVQHNVSRMETARGSMGNPLMSGYAGSTGQNTHHSMTGPSKRHGSNFEDYRA